jgi:hypothetical protein
MWILWAAYKEGSFPELSSNMDKDALYAHMKASLGMYSSLMLVEDYNRRFKDHRGAVCLIKGMSDGWKFEPEAIWFSWATKLNILRGNVRFLKWMMHNKEIGVCTFQTSSDTKNLYDHVKKYGVLNYVGRIPGGQRIGDAYVWSLRGKLRGIEGRNDGAGNATTADATTGAATDGTATATTSTSAAPTDAATSTATDATPTDATAPAG